LVAINLIIKTIAKPKIIPESLTFNMGDTTTFNYISMSFPSPLSHKSGLIQNYNFADIWIYLHNSGCVQNKNYAKKARYFNLP
jgi:uracil DNA glycosylase